MNKWKKKHKNLSPGVLKSMEIKGKSQKYTTDVAFSKLIRDSTQADCFYLMSPKYS